MKRLTEKNAPAGSRVLVKDDVYSAPLREVTVLEWSPKRRVKLASPNGHEEWCGDDDIPFFVEMLPASMSVSSVWRCPPVENPPSTLTTTGGPSIVAEWIWSDPPQDVKEV